MLCALHKCSIRKKSSQHCILNIGHPVQEAIKWDSTQIEEIRAQQEEKGWDGIPVNNFPFLSIMQAPTRKFEYGAYAASLILLLCSFSVFNSSFVSSAICKLYVSWVHSAQQTRPPKIQEYQHMSNQHTPLTYIIITVLVIWWWWI